MVTTSLNKARIYVTCWCVDRYSLSVVAATLFLFWRSSPRSFISQDHATGQFGKAMTSSISESIKRRPQENDQLPCLERKQNPHRICMNRKGGKKNKLRQKASIKEFPLFRFMEWAFQACGKLTIFPVEMDSGSDGTLKSKEFFWAKWIRSTNRSSGFFFKPIQPWFEGLGGCCAKLLFLLFSVTNWCAYKQTATQKTPLLQLQRMLPFLGQLSSASVTSLNFWEDPWILNQKIRTEATQYQLKHVFVNN